MLVVSSQNCSSSSSTPATTISDHLQTPITSETTASTAGLADVIIDDDDEGQADNSLTSSTSSNSSNQDDDNNSSPMLTGAGLAEVLPDNSSSTGIPDDDDVEDVEIVNTTAVITSEQPEPEPLPEELPNSDDVVTHHNRQGQQMSNEDGNNENEQTQAPLSSWLIPELAKVAETLQLLRARLPNSSAPQSWQLEDAICNALEATRRVADQYMISEDGNFSGTSPSDNSLIDVMMGEHHYPNNHSEYQTLSRYANPKECGSQPDYQKLALISGLVPPSAGDYEASMVTTLSDEDEYDRLAYEFPIHPSLRKRVPRPPPNMVQDYDESPSSRSGGSLLTQVTPRPKLVDVAVGRCDGSVQVNDKACNTYRVLNVSRPVQAVETPIAKFSKHVQTHLLVTDKCVGEDDDDLRVIEVECQTEDVEIKAPILTEDSWAQTEDKFTENVSVYANMLRDFGQSVSTQTDFPGASYVPSPAPLVVDTAPKMHMTMQISPRQMASPTNNQNHPPVPPLSLKTASIASRQFSSTSSSCGGGSLRSPSSTSTPIAATSTSGCYQLYVRIDQNNRGSTANLMTSHGQTSGNKLSIPANSSNCSGGGVHHGRLLSPSEAEGASVPSSNSTVPASVGVPALMSDVMMMMNSAILSPMDSGTAFLPSSINSSTMSPPTSDSQATSSATNEHSLSDDRGSSPRSWQSPIHISGPNETSPILQRPDRMRRASVNPQATPFRSGQLAAVTDKTSFKSLIKISEGSPPEIRQTAGPAQGGSTSNNNTATKNKAKAIAGQLTQISNGNHFAHSPMAQTTSKQVTKIIHRLDRDPSIRAWCSVDNLMRHNLLAISNEELVVSSGPDPEMVQERVIVSPPPLFREFGELTTASTNDDSSIVNERPIDCEQVTVATTRPGRLNNHQTVVLPPPKTKQLSMNDVSKNEVKPVFREPFLLLKPSKRNNNAKQQVNDNNNSQSGTPKQPHRDNVICLGRRTLVSVGSGEDSDTSVMETPFEKTPRGGSNKHNKAIPGHNRRSNYPALAALTARNNNNGGEDFEHLPKNGQQHSSGSNTSNSSGSNNNNNGTSVLSRLQNLLHIGGNSKQKRPALPIPC